MKFYSLKTRSYVDVPDGSVNKTKMVRETKSGKQTRYAMTTTHNGVKMYKFVSEAAYKASSAKEV